MVNNNNKNEMNTKYLTESTRYKFTDKKKENLIQSATARTFALPGSRAAGLFFELRGLYNRGQVGLWATWSAYQSALNKI